MESMQFVNPHEVNPLIQNVPVQLANVYSQVSSKTKMPDLGDTIQNNNIKLKMEEFSDLSEIFSGAHINLTGSTDELGTPVFDKDAADFTYPSVKSTENNNGLKVKVEYNAQIYSCGKTMYKDLNLGTDNQVQNKENYSISRVGNKQSEMNLYQPFAHAISSKDNMDDVYSTPYQDLNLFGNTAAYNEMSFNSNFSVNSNIKYSNSTVSSPQDDRYSYISSPSNDQQEFSVPDENDHTFEIKPKLNLMIDQFKFPIKHEGPSTLNTPDVINEVVNMGTDFNILDLVNSEDITVLSADEELLLSLTSPSTPSLPPSTPSTISSKPSSPEKRSRRRKLSDDDDDDDDDDYIPPVKRRSTVRLLDIDIENSNSSDDSDYEDTKPIRKAKPRGRPPKSADSVTSNSSKDTSLSKYRELRDKNNEASRKSRLKRRMKELKYEQESDDLHSKNIRLKAQVEELEKMVSTFRNNLFKILVNK